MKRNLRRAAVYGVAGLATAALGATTANALVDNTDDSAAPAPVQAQAPAPAPAPAHVPGAAPVAPKQATALPKAHTAPAQPAAPKPVHHVKPAAAHRAAVPVALSKPQVKKVRQAPQQKRFVVQAAAKAPTVSPLRMAIAPATPKLDTAIKAVDDARKTVKTAEKTLRNAKNKLAQSEKDLKDLRESMKPGPGKKPCHDHKDRHDRIKKANLPDDLAKRLAALRTEGKTISKSTHKSGNTVTKTASSSGNGASSWSSATSTNGIVSANAW
ncbi:hypothetical protein [Amycolatopsis sp. NPDC052450]|uniref:hypothetical protein n=1 Tax=Amycolatopsis sp. NPDC052450 TaxID=3363937 RepID=UPI0037C85667